jgi:hypothetical protein
MCSSVVLSYYFSRLTLHLFMRSFVFPGKPSPPPIVLIKLTDFFLLMTIAARASTVSYQLPVLASSSFTCLTKQKYVNLNATATQQ